MASPTSAGPNPARIFATMRAFQESAVMNTAIDLGVFTAIAGGAKTAPEIAGKVGASERGTRILCDTLVTSELLTKQDGRYENTPDTAAFLNRDSPAYMGGVKEFLCGPEMMAELQNNLTNCVIKGGTQLPGEGTVSDANPVWVQFARVMGPMMYPAAQFIASQLSESGPLKVLDIAAGHGLFGITIAKRNPEAQITALDWASVLEVASENAQKAQIAARFSTIAGSAFEVDYGSDYDIVLLTNILHHFDTATNERLIRKAYAALRPGGRAITLEFVPDDNRVTPPNAARFALIMLSSTQHGDAYTFREYETMFHKAGFAINVCHLIETQQSVIISTK